MSDHRNDQTGYCPVCEGPCVYCKRPASPGLRRAVESLRDRVDPETERLATHLRCARLDMTVFEQAADRMEEMSRLLNQLVIGWGLDSTLPTVARARELLR